jgi:hypothetical protein
MSTIVTRAGKGDTLSWTEMDSNFSNLNTDKIQSTNAGSTGNVLTKTAGGAEWAAASSGMNMAMYSTSTWSPPSSGSFITSTATMTPIYVGTSGITIPSTSKFSVPAGTWRIIIQLGGISGATGGGNYRMFNETDSIEVVQAFTSGTVLSNTKSQALSDPITLASTKTIAMQSYSTGNVVSYTDVTVTFIKTA